jgi:hypothetical protein
VGSHVSFHPLLLLLPAVSCVVWYHTLMLLADLSTVGHDRSRDLARIISMDLPRRGGPVIRLTWEGGRRAGHRTVARARSGPTYEGRLIRLGDRAREAECFTHSIGTARVAGQFLEAGWRGPRFAARVPMRLPRKESVEGTCGSVESGCQIPDQSHRHPDTTDDCCPHRSPNGHSDHDGTCWGSGSPSALVCGDP